VTDEAGAGGPAEGTGNRTLAVLLALAMFVLVVDTSPMNVSISAVVEDLDTPSAASSRRSRSRRWSPPRSS
jgi:hypothetical protein